MKRAVCTVIRLVAAGCFVVGGMVLGLELLRHRLPDASISVWRCVTGILVAGLGLLLFAASAGLAGQLTDDFDE